MKMIDMGEIKMVNAIMYFAKNVKFPNKTKIFKLLSFLDFDYFGRLGVPVTGQKYIALEKGPVPTELHEDIKAGKCSEYFYANIKIIPWKSGLKEGFGFHARKNPDMRVFSPFEIEIMENIVFKYKDLKAEEISEVSHLKNTPWEKTKREKGLFSEIDYITTLAHDAPVSETEARERYRTNLEMRRLFGNGRRSERT